ncbi:MAG: hypothetical protein ABL867_02415, partial [Rickettsiales bacterium]
MKFTLSTVKKYIPFFATFIMLSLLWYATSYSGPYGSHRGFPIIYQAYSDMCTLKGCSVFFSYPILYWDILFLLTFPFIVQNAWYIT